MKMTTSALALAAAIAIGACGGADTPKNQAEPKADAKPAAQAADAPAAAATADATGGLDVSDPNVVRISVPTMQCETCAEAITRGVKGVPECEKVHVDVASKTAFVKVKNNTPETIAKIEQAIGKTGYTTKTVTRDAKAYEGLPDCCKEKADQKGL